MFSRLAEGIAAALERHLWRWASLFAALLLACTIVRDIRGKLWIDEFCTLEVARQTIPMGIIRAVLEGADAQPPLYAMLVHATLPLVHSDPLAIRLPSTLGYCATFFCLLAFYRRGMPAVYAFAAAMLVSVDCLYFSHTGRPYGLVLGCAAGALLSWRAATSGAHRRLGILGLAFCLAVMPALHFFAMLFLGPLLLAEIVRWRSSGKPDAAVLAAMTAPVLVMAAHYPLIAADRRFMAHYWSPASWSMIPQFYQSYFLPMLGVCLLPLISIQVLPKGLSQPAAGQQRWRFDEWVALVALAAMPVVAVAVSTFTTHSFVPRYAIWAVLGLAALTGALIAAAAGNRAATGAILLCCSLGALTVLETAALLRTPVLLGGGTSPETLASLPDSAEPIVVNDLNVFLELAYYAAPRVRERLVCPISFDLDLRYRKQDTSALLRTGLSHTTTLPIVSLDAFLAAHRRFLVTAVPWDYLPKHLAATGYRMAAIRRTPDVVVYEATLPETAAAVPPPR